MVDLTGFLIAHGSALILPLSVIEGPVVTISTGFLTAQGYFDWYTALVLLVCGDLVGDALYYWIGRTSIGPLTSLRRRLGVRGGLTPAFQQDLRQNATKMLVIGKWTHSIGLLVLVGSGLLRLPFLRFLLVNLVATIPKSTVLFGFGYFAGNYYPFFERHAVLGASLALVAGVVSILLIVRRTDGIWADP